MAESMGVEWTDRLEALVNAGLKMGDAAMDAAVSREATRGKSAINGSARRGSVSLKGLQQLRRLGLREVTLHGASYNSGRKALEAAGFKLVETTSTGRKVFRHPRTGATVVYDSGDALVGNQKPHWHIYDSSGQGFDRNGHPVDSSSNAGHIPAKK
ncbi:hypothetical protein ESB00_17845 [Oleiharenicola lentus]|uniref:Uncharacterized protein n=1 Tax=Oleiharenicola lentus TaxID=2508720 RepID=A0A4Q1C544_9BACT|nr:hypothetical protein [Oleiharenicola lentus]RXK53554.1 hypothetical protein ESB00_17845 [Oleiharenicola lentus]